MTYGELFDKVATQLHIVDKMDDYRPAGIDTIRIWLIDGTTLIVSVIDGRTVVCKEADSNVG